jgi:hypothetical protein
LLKKINYLKNYERIINYEEKVIDDTYDGFSGTSWLISAIKYKPENVLVNKVCGNTCGYQNNTELHFI